MYRPELSVNESEDAFAYAINAYHPAATMLAATRYRQGGNGESAYATLIGSTHEDRNPESPKYELGVALLDSWRELTASQPRDKRLIVYEGRNPFTGKTQPEAIIDYFGESGLLKWYARKHDIPVVSGEPTRHDEFRVLHASGYAMGDGIVGSGKEIIRAILGVRILPFLSQDAQTPGTEAQRIFDQKFSIEDFTDPGHPLVALCRAVTEPERYTELLDAHPKVKELARYARTVQGTRTLELARTVFDLYFDKTVSVFAWTGLHHARRLHRVLCQTKEIYDPAAHQPGLHAISGEILEGAVPHPTIVPYVGTLSLRSVLTDRKKHIDLWLPGTTHSK